ncbi:unnamed protein product [Moneuplotes crassus]|uniref:Uncharacterized protein n=2 Tax=Euplotes crassus TaxID=5936 RepID=A0AAD1X828_EUPCR|nr:unnamed protein product [Moneuplotes crassus]
MNPEVEIKENPDIAYIKRDDIGLVIAKGLAKTYKAQPQDPVDFLAKWLLNHSNVANEQDKQQESKAKTQELKDRKSLEEQNKAKEKEEELKKEKENRVKIEDFKDRVEHSEDLSDHLQGFTSYLQEHTGATGVYIGKLIKPFKKITDDDNDTAHEDPEAPEIIKYIHATPDHDFLIDKTLNPDQGLTHEIFKPEEPKEDEAPPEGEGEGDKEKKEEKKVPKHSFIEEVVREHKMHYFRVPRLGSYLAVELKYDSCLNQESFDKAFEDYLDCINKKQEQEREKLEYQEKLEDEKANAGDDWQEPEPKEWPEIKEKLYETSEHKYVVCLDTLGQDRPFTEEEKEFVLENIQYYSDNWTKIENSGLKKDIEERYKTFQKDKDYIEGENANNLAAEEEKFIEDYFDGLDEQLEGDARAEKTPEVRQKFLLEKLCSEEWKKELLKFREYQVIRFPRFMQSLLYFLGHTREEICEEGTNKLFWKIAKNKLNDGIFENMKKYTHVGPKDAEFKRYQLINFIEKNIDGITIEDIEQYSYVLSRLFKWLTTSIDMRKDDIIKRKEIKEKEKEEREQAIADHKEWQENREKAMEEAKKEFEDKLAEEEANKTQEAQEENKDDDNQDEKPPEEKPVFDEKKFFETYDAETPEVKIPEVVVDDIDNDYEVPASEE